MKRLYRSNVDKKIAGVCGGIAEYLDVDPTLIRVIAVIGLFMGWGFLTYLVCWAIMQRNPDPSK